MNWFYYLLGITLAQAATRLNFHSEFSEDRCMDCEFCCIRNECRTLEVCSEHQYTMTILYSIFLILVITLGTALGWQVKTEGRGVNMKD
jgi:hypothetical protein